MPVPLLDLTRQYAYLKPDMDKAVLNVLAHQKFILGPEVAQLEKELAAYCGTKYALGVASGTDALIIALQACGVGPGDEVITSNFSFFASAGVVSRLGATPVFVDVDPDSFNIDPKLIEAAITPKTKVIMPVHLFGQMADMDTINAIAKKHGLKVIEDGAQSIGAEYKGKTCGQFGDLGCFSFFPSKNLGGGGDGGLITTNSEEMYELCKILREHGQKPQYHHLIIGYNSRLDTLQAAMLLVKLPHLRKWSEKRIEHAARYDKEFVGVPNIRTPKVMPYATFHIYNQYTLCSPKREKVFEGLRKAGIGTAIYYPVPFHLQECFAYLKYPKDAFPHTTKAANEVFSIPVYPEMTDAEQSEVIKVIKELVA
jgi:dTDP-4-amino-4,6-dideoxygalactose transaminase